MKKIGERPRPTISSQLAKVRTLEVRSWAKQETKTSRDDSITFHELTKEIEQYEAWGKWWASESRSKEKAQELFPDLRYTTMVVNAANSTSIYQESLFSNAVDKLSSRRDGVLHSPDRLEQVVVLGSILKDNGLFDFISHGQSASDEEDEDEYDLEAVIAEAFQQQSRGEDAIKIAD